MRMCVRVWVSVRECESACVWEYLNVFEKISAQWVPLDLQLSSPYLVISAARVVAMEMKSTNWLDS